VIPIALMGKDIIARAKNGTGKTGSFVIPILEKININQKYVQSLILVPTRELALQTSATIREIGKYLNVQCMITTGGTNLKDDIYRLYNPVQILVGTPGRVFDLSNKGAFDLSKCGIIVLDEADKLLSQDFHKVLIDECVSVGGAFLKSFYKGYFPISYLKKFIIYTDKNISVNYNKNEILNEKH
jgi:ATP-dependent RNA helicase DDX6/DHH1